MITPQELLPNFGICAISSDKDASPSLRAICEESCDTLVVFNISSKLLACVDRDILNQILSQSLSIRT